MRFERDREVIGFLDADDLPALQIERVDRHVGRCLDGDIRGRILLSFFIERAQQSERRGFGRTDEPHPGAMRAGDRRTGEHARAQALARHLEEPELADLADLNPRAIAPYRVVEPLLDIAVVAAVLHVDEVDHDQAREVAQPKLARDLVGRFEIGLVRGLLDRMLARRFARVHVDRYERLGLVDDDVAARFQSHDRTEHRIELGLDLEALKQRQHVLVGLHVLRMARHEHAHELFRVAISRLAVDEDLRDLLVVEIADGALDEASLLIDERRRIRFERELADRIPEANQIFVIALDLRLGAVGARGADNETHSLRQFQRLRRRFQPFAVGRIGDLARDAAAARSIGHEHAIAPGKREECGEGRALVAALLFHDLHQHHLAAFDHLLDFVLAAARTGPLLAGFFAATEGGRRACRFGPNYRRGLFGHAALIERGRLALGRRLDGITTALG